jgi:hypothetical protein
MGLLIMKICCGKSSFDTLGCNKALALLRLHSSPQKKMIDFIVGEEGKDSG